MSVCSPGFSYHTLSAAGQCPGRRYFKWGLVCVHPTNRPTQDHGNAYCTNSHADQCEAWHMQYSTETNLLK